MNSKEEQRRIIKRLERLEKAVFSSTTNVSCLGKTSKANIKNSLPDLILMMRDRGIFKQPKSASEVHKELSQIYHCELDRVDTALRRLKARKKLRVASKTIKGEKILAYVW
ncbi:MAG: hypothetical protein WCY23_00475 [Candidatus Omnitrophota bacterium]